MSDKGGDFDAGRSFSDRRRAAVQNQLQRCSFEGPPSADHDDGYTKTNYYQSRNSRDEKTMLRGDSGGALNEMVEQQEREPTVKRPPSMDYKPRRSESEDPGKTAFTTVKSIQKPDGTVITETTRTFKDVDGWKSTTYYEDADKNETGFKMTGMNTSSSVGDMQAVGEE
ncbi:hypothetical protein COCOBI_02-2120 [Coccomyxa sp. Obi]|nr:hypothetical protein COCOBI_02-2120 [Coccomyxa sp. Obi]